MSRLFLLKQALQARPVLPANLQLIYLQLSIFNRYLIYFQLFRGFLNLIDLIYFLLYLIVQ